MWWLSCVAVLGAAVHVAARDQSAAAIPDVELRQVRLASAKSVPRVEKQTLPAYTAKAAALDGVVEIEVVVGSDGRVMHARAARTLAGAPGLEKACIDSLASWRFRTASVNGRVVPSLVSVHFEFVPGERDRKGRVTAQVKLLPRVAAPARETLSNLSVIDLMQLPAKPPADSGLVYPVPVRRVLPEYTNPAIRARLQGSVELEVVILPDGTVGAASITRSLDSTHGLDGEALIAARYWYFAPATRHGTPIAATSRLILDFTLQ